MLGYGFGDAVYSASGSTISIGFVLGIVALVGAWATSQVDFAAWNEPELAIVVFTVPDGPKMNVSSPGSFVVSGRRAFES